MLQKGVFHYEYLTSESALEQNCLPSKDKFQSSLKQSHKTEEGYALAKKIFTETKCKNIKDYSNVNSKINVPLDYSKH